MFYKILADFILIFHLLFILFVLLGGLLAFKKPKVIWLHIPVFIWGVLISIFRWVCPLTPLETYLRLNAGQEGYEGGFISHYIIPIIYPDDFGPVMGMYYAIIVIACNVIIYSLLICSIKKHR